MSNFHNLLSCWHRLEHFHPAVLKSNKKNKRLKEEGSIPWTALNINFDEEFTFIYTVYLGVFKISEVVDFASYYFKEENTSENERDGESYFATIKVSSNGYYVENSLGISFLPWALGQLEANKIASDNWSTAFDTLYTTIETELQSIFYETVTGEDIEEIEKFPKTLDLAALAKAESVIQELCNWSYTPSTTIFFRKRKKRLSVAEKKNGKITSTPELMNSFYVTDLEKIIGKVKSINKNSAFSDYLNGNLDKPIDKVDLSKNTSSIKEVLHPNNFPDGCWPSAFGLNLMQQYSVNKVLQNVNKVKNYKKLFSVNGPPGTGKTTLLRHIIAGLVVERAKKLATLATPEDAFRKAGNIENKSGYKNMLYTPIDSLNSAGMVIMSSNNGAVENVSEELPKIKEVEPYEEEVAYFKKVANEVETSNWGMISAVLGNMDNRREFKNKYWSVWENKIAKKVGFQSYFKENTINDLQPWKEIVTKFNTKLLQVQKEKDRLAAIANKVDKLSSAKDNDDIFLKEKLELKQNFADSTFWNQLESKESQNCCPWHTEKLQRLQSELFILSLKLQEVLLRTANRKNHMISSSLAAFFEFIDGKADPGSRMAESLWNLFFLIVPVVSTTFASADRMFSKVGSEKLPWLFIDEAGQAIPQAAAGGIWRSKNVVVVGDPLQIEPVVAIPEVITRNLRKHFDLSERQINPELSVQIAADRANSYGTYLEDYNGKASWIGSPLRVHRRCIEPMFSIANRIAYNGTMFLASKDSENIATTLQTSFIHCPGIVENRHFVQSQGKLVKDLIEKEIVAIGGLPNLYVITPFSEIRSELRSYLKKVVTYNHVGLNTKNSESFFEKWVDNHVGTVHTFQGKQADSVIFCLGLDERTANSANWAAQKPNLLNVALTRAKYRFIAIGDQNIWLTKPYFDQLEEICFE